jgi:branched-chain amino acid transport system substrate-binding protein
MKRLFLTLGLVASLVASQSSCERKGGDGGGGGSTGPIKIGIYGDLSGQTSSFGQSTKNGATMAIDEINKAGGINGRQIEFIFEDDQGQPAQAATVVTKLINQDKVHALLGEVASSNSLAAAPVAQAAKIPMITPSSTNPKVTQIGDYIFRVCFMDDFQASSMAKFAATTLKAKTAAILGDVNSDYSKGMTQYFVEEFARHGGQIVDRQAYTQTDPDFKGQLTAIRAKNPDVIFVPGYYGQVGVIAKQAKELSIKAPLLGGDGWDAPQLWSLGGAALNGSYMTNHYSVDDPSPAVQKFVAGYKARYGGLAPDAIAALAYDAANVLAEAIRRAGSTDGPKIRDAIAQTQNFVGITGTIGINAQRNAVKPAVIFELQDGKLLPKDTIYPEGMTPPASPAGGTTASPAAPGGAASPAAPGGGANANAANANAGGAGAANANHANANHANANH